MKYKLIQILIPISLLCSSCYFSSSLVTNDTSDANKKGIAAEKIEVYATEKAARPYDILGTVICAADAGENSKRSVRLLKKQAELLGADAIVNLDLEFKQGYWTIAICAKGTAVKYK